MKDTIILFDLDGTLIDSTQAIYESFCEAFRNFNQPIPDYQSVSSQIGHTLEDMFASLGVESQKINDFILSYKEHYRKVCKEKTQLLPYAKESILEAHTFAHLGVVTTKTGQYSKILLEHFNLLHYFTCVIGREDVINAKPSPEAIFKALEQMPKLPKTSVTMIGDTPLDIQAANSANIQSIAVLSGYATKETLQNYTTNIFEDALCAILHLKNKG